MISLTSLGHRVVSPLEEGDDAIALRAAVLVPTVEKQFLERYDGQPLPVDRIGQNVLESMGVPPESAERVFNLIVENAESVGFLKKIKEKTYVDLGGGPLIPVTAVAEPIEAQIVHSAEAASPVGHSAPAAAPRPHVGSPRPRKVFVSHGKSRRVVDQLKELLQFGDFEAVVSVDRESTSKPVPQKVMDDMRSCGAGIIHVTAEQKLLDTAGTEHRMLNQNVLIEIGAAMALYDDQFILLVEDGTTLPSNLQGLYEVRYTGDELGYDATMKVLKVLNQFKTGAKSEV